MTEWAPDTTPRQPRWSPTAQRTFILHGRLLGEVQHTDEGSDGFVAHLRLHAPCLLDDKGVRHPLPTSSDAELFTAAVCGGKNGARLAFVMELSAEPAFTAQVTRRVADFRWLHAALCDMCASGGVAGGALSGVAVPPLPPVLDALAVDTLHDHKGNGLVEKNENRNWLSSAVSSGLSNVQSAQRDLERSAATALSMGAGVLGIGKSVQIDADTEQMEGGGGGAERFDAVDVCAAASARAGFSAVDPVVAATAATAVHGIRTAADTTQHAIESAPCFGSAAAAAAAACAAAARGSALAAALRTERYQQEHAGTSTDGEFEVVVGTSGTQCDAGAGFFVSADRIGMLGAEAGLGGIGGESSEVGSRNRTISGGADVGALTDGGATPGSIADELEQGLNAIVDASARALAAVGGGGSSEDDDESGNDEIGGPLGPTIDVLDSDIGGCKGDSAAFPGAGATLVRHIASELAHTVGQWLSHPELSRACEHFGMFFEEHNTGDWLAYMSSNMGAVTRQLKRTVDAENLGVRAQAPAYALVSSIDDADKMRESTQIASDCVHEVSPREVKANDEEDDVTQPTAEHGASDDIGAVEWWGGCTVEHVIAAHAKSVSGKDSSRFVNEDKAVVTLGWRLAAEYRGLALLQRALARLCAGETSVAADGIASGSAGESGMLGVSRAWRAVGSGCTPLATMDTLAAASADAAAQSAATKAATTAADSSTVQEAIVQAVRTALPEPNALYKCPGAGMTSDVKDAGAGPSAGSVVTMLQELARSQGRSCALGGHFDKLAAKVDSALAVVASLLTAVGERQERRAALERAISQEADTDRKTSGAVASATHALQIAHKNLLSSVRTYDRVACGELHANVLEFVSAAQAVLSSRRAALRTALTAIQRAENDARALPKREADRALRCGKATSAKVSASGRTVRPVLVVAPPGTRGETSASTSVTSNDMTAAVTAAAAPPVPVPAATTKSTNAFGTGFGSAYLYGTAAATLREFEVQFHAGAIGLSFRSIGTKFVVREARAQAAEALVASGDHIVGVNGIALPELRKQLAIGARGGQRALAEHIRALQRPFVVMFEGKRSDTDWLVLQQCLARRTRQTQERDNE